MIKLQKVVDRYIGFVLCHLFGIFVRNKPVSEHPQSIAIVKLWAVGESILVLPMLRLLRETYPDATIDVWCRTRNKDVFNLSGVSVYTIESNSLTLMQRFRRYDVVLDCEPFLNISALITWWMSKVSIGFSNQTRSRLYNVKVPYNDNQHVVLTYCDLLWFKFDIPATLEPLAAGPLPSFMKNDRYIGFCVGSAESAHSRQWPTDKFAQLADLILDSYNVTILLVGAPDSVDLNNEVVKRCKGNIMNIAGKTSLAELFMVVKQCELFISNDTGPMHIAAAQGVRTIGLFGPNTPVRFAPYGPGNVSIYNPVLNKPCINVHLGEVPDCSTHNHMSKIQVNDVFSAVQKILNNDT